MSCNNGDWAINLCNKCQVEKAVNAVGTSAKKVEAHLKSALKHLFNFQADKNG
jgi:hypothetical protein